MSESKKDDDPFDELASLSQQAYEEGYKEGRKEGEKEAYENGYSIGKKMAFAVGKELGEYYRLCQSYQNTVGEKDEQKSSKLARQIIELIDRFDFEQCHDDKFEASFNSIRDKFKQFSSLTNTRSSTNNNDMTFKLSNNPKLSF